MQSDIDNKRDALEAVCRRFGVTRLEVFGSAARGAGFDPNAATPIFSSLSRLPLEMILPRSLILRTRSRGF
jgi:hypothetical protein